MNHAAGRRSSGRPGVRQNGWVISPAMFSYRVGGPIGPRGIRRGRWFDPTTWAFAAATITWLIVMVRQIPCRPIGEHFPDQFMRLCYSDIPTLYLGRGISTGAGLYTEVPLEYPVLIGYLMSFARWLTGVFGGQVGPEASYADQVAASQIFFQITAVLLGCLFLGTVWTHLRLARGRRGERPADPARSWDAVLIATSPVVMANGLINWDLLVVFLTSLGLLVWTRRQPLAAGGVLGLAFAAKFYPILVLIAITMLCVRCDRYRDLTKVWVAAGLTWLAVNLPPMLTAWPGWSEFWLKNADRGADLGSIWYVLTLVQLQVPAVSAIAFLCMAAGGCAVAWLVLTAPRRPRLAQVAVLLLIVFLVFNKVYSPQYVLWLLPLVVLARPVLLDVALWTAAELVYYVAIWGFLQGLLGLGTGSEWMYWVAVLGRACAQVWFALRVVDDIQQPWDDPVRQPMVDDPIGGVLDHEPDAAWLLALGARRARARNGTRRAAAGWPVAPGSGPAGTQAPGGHKPPGRLAGAGDPPSAADMPGGARNAAQASAAQAGPAAAGPGIPPGADLPRFEA